MNADLQTRINARRAKMQERLSARKANQTARKAGKNLPGNTGIVPPHLQTPAPNPRPRSGSGSTPRPIIPGKPAAGPLSTMNGLARRKPLITRK